MEDDPIAQLMSVLGTGPDEAKRLLEVMLML